MRCYVFLVVLFSVSPAFAETATQTDWSGGPGVPGPTLDWANEFYSNNKCSWLEIPGEISILRIVCREIGNIDLLQSAGVDDIDGDGDIDVIAGSRYEGGVFKWFENTNGMGVIWNEHEIDNLASGISCLCTDDIDGDNDTDVLVYDPSSYDIIWLENADGLGTDWIDHTVKEDYDNPSRVYLADMDGDSDIDAIGVSGYNNDIRWWENTNGLGTDWTEHFIDDSLELPFFIHFADVDSDSNVDLVVAAHDGHAVVWLENVDGIGYTWEEHAVSNTFGGAACVHSADLDGDGDEDILGAAQSDDLIAWWENIDGIGHTWEEHTIKDEYNGAYSVHTADMDADGDVDVLGSAYLADYVTWWENADGEGEEWIEHIIDDSFEAPFSVCDADINGDGNIDVFSAAVYDDICWWDINMYPYTASFESSILYTVPEVDWEVLSWTAQTPFGTGVALQVRASDNYSDMGNWSENLTVSPVSLQEVLDDFKCYVQYRVQFTTAFTDTTPVLSEVSIAWNELQGIEEANGPATFELFPFSPNPVTESATVSFNLPGMTTAGFKVFDVTGREVVRIPEAEYLEGFHQIVLDELVPGLYFCLVQAEGFAATGRFVVME